MIPNNVYDSQSLIISRLDVMQGRWIEHFNVHEWMNDHVFVCEYVHDR